MLTSGEVGELQKQLVYEEYAISIESKNLRFILRSIERMNSG